jgi:hypothetical protein
MQPKVGNCYAVFQGDGTLWKVEVVDVVTDCEDIALDKIKIGDRVIPGIYCQGTVIVPGSVTKKVGSVKSWVVGLQTQFLIEWSETIEVLYG